MVAETVAAGLLSATHDMTALADADVILIWYTDGRDGLGPDYGPLFEALGSIALALQERATVTRAGHRVRVDARAVLDGTRCSRPLRPPRPHRGRTSCSATARIG